MAKRHQLAQRIAGSVTGGVTGGVMGGITGSIGSLAVSLAVILGAPAPVAAQEISAPQSSQLPQRIAQRVLAFPEAELGPASEDFVLPSSDVRLGAEAPVWARSTPNMFGMPGLVDMPNATALPDGEISLNLSHFSGISKITLAFQITPRITGAFRYNRYADTALTTFTDYYDRSFDLHVLAVKESDFVPAIAVGFRDFVGTGLQASEYVVASKNFTLPGLGGGATPGLLQVTAGLGWGRLGSLDPIGAPLGSTRPLFSPGDTGGEVDFGQFFRGDMAAFAGLEYRPGGQFEKFRLKLEYSSDSYASVARFQPAFTRESPLNFGLEYHATDTLRLGLYSLYGSEIGFMANLSLNPRRNAAGLALAGPGPLPRRAPREEFPELWVTDWRETPRTQDMLSQRLSEILEPQDITVTGLELIGATRGRVRVENTRYQSSTIVVGRTARAMAAFLPPSVETFDIVLEDDGLALSQVTFNRSDLENIDGLPDRHAALAAVTTLSAAPTARASRDGANVPDLYPRASFDLGGYFSTSFFDPARPVRIDVGLSAKARFEPTRGLVFAGELRQKLVGNIGENKATNSRLEPVRTNARIYSLQEDVALNNATVSYSTKLPGDFYGRATAGYLERMFGGVSTELLWKPVDSPLALGVELNYVGQRDFDQRFGFQDYRTFTGHASLYYDFGGGYLGQLDAGRYLAGDDGATVTLTREFENGWRVGAFATFTNVSAADFGEGSFDKGIRVTIPLQAIAGLPTQRALTRTIRPVSRDGGRRLRVDGRLYDRVRAGHGEELFGNWGQVWR